MSRLISCCTMLLWGRLVRFSSGLSPADSMCSEPDRIIRSGSLHIESAGDSPDENLAYIPRSNEVQQLINRLIDEDDLRRRTHRRDLPDAAGSDPASASRGDETDDTTAIPRQRPDRPELAEERRRPRDLGDGSDRPL